MAKEVKLVIEELNFEQNTVRNQQVTYSQNKSLVIVSSGSQAPAYCIVLWCHLAAGL